MKQGTFEGADVLACARTHVRTYVRKCARTYAFIASRGPPRFKTLAQDSHDR